MPVLFIERFTDNNMTPAKINAAFAAIMSLVNGAAGEVLAQFSGQAGTGGENYLPISGGDLLGQLTAPSLEVGVGLNKHPVVTTNDAAQAAVRGVVLKAAAVVDLAQAISNPPTQAEVTAIQNKVNALLVALRNAGTVTP